jgi:hypothetical protein
MMRKKEILRYLFLILCVFVLFIIPWASVFGIKNAGLIETIGLFQRIAGAGILTYIIITIIYQIYGKSLAQEMKEEEIKEVHLEDTRQSLFKPTIGVLIFFVLFLSILIFGFIEQILKNKVDFGNIIFLLGLIIFFIWMWYITPVFIFREDSVEIKSFLFYVLHVDRKTVIPYADITLVRPDAKFKDNYYGMDRRYRIQISTNETTKYYGLPLFNSDIVAKIYLRFKEKTGG